MMWNKIFVFGSNAAGAHSGGSARAAVLQHGAIEGVAVGMAGNSYAIPTLDSNLRQLPINVIAHYVSQFLDFAENHPDVEFEIVAIGCGIAGFTTDQIAPMFNGATVNCILPLEFLRKPQADRGDASAQ